LAEVLEGVDGDAHEANGKGDGRVVAGVDDAIEVSFVDALEQPAGASSDGIEVGQRRLGGDRADCSDIRRAVAVAGVVGIGRQANEAAQSASTHSCVSPNASARCSSSTRARCHTSHAMGLAPSPGGRRRSSTVRSSTTAWAVGGMRPNSSTRSAAAVTPPP
jgi:hypothetical protein